MSLKMLQIISLPRVTACVGLAPPARTGGILVCAVWLALQQSVSI